MIYALTPAWLPPTALDLLGHGVYCKRKRLRGAGRREHVRGRGAAIVGTTGEWRFAASALEKARKKVAKLRVGGAIP